MIEIIVSKNGAGQRCDRFLSKAAPGVSLSSLQKAFRKKDVKRNGKPCRAAEHLAEGDVVRLYGNHPAEKTTSPPAGGTPPWRRMRAEASRVQNSPLHLAYAGCGRGGREADGLVPSIVYEDDTLLVLHKPPGIPSQPDFEEMARDYVNNYPLSTVHYQPDGFTPSLCHRLDRNTEGLLLFAKTAETLRDITAKIKNREIKKTYRCVVEGVPSPSSGEWRDWLWKDAKEKRVYAQSMPSPGAKEAVLCYTVLKTLNGKSLLEIELVTGRTHQIRVQCASRGFPILGDGKYGKGRKGGPLSLCAAKLEFDGKVFEIDKKFHGFD